MSSLLKRHYRRLATFTGGMALFCMFLLASLEPKITDLAYVLLFFICVLAFGFMAIGLYSVKPSQRGILEIAGISALLSTVFLFYIPYTGLFPTLSGLAVFFGIMTSLWFFLNSRLSYQLARSIVWRDRNSTQVPYPAKLIWKHVVPGATIPEDHCTGIMGSYTEDDEDKDTLHVTFKGRQNRSASYSLTFLEKQEPNLCRFYFEGEEADGAIVDGIFKLEINALDRDTCVVITNEERAGLSYGGYIERWFDDSMGFQIDLLRKKLDELYGEARGTVRPARRQPRKPSKRNAA